MILNVSFGVATLMAAGFPDTGRLIWLYARAANFLDKKAAGRQRGVAKHLAVHAEARAASQQAILRIDFEQLRRGPRGLAIGRRQDQLLVKALNVPPVFAKIHGEPIEEFRMAGPSAHHSKIFRRFDQPRAKKFSPHAIYGHSRSQWIGFADGPLSQSATVERRIGRQGRQKVGNARPHALDPGTKCTAVKNIRIGKPRSFLAYDGDGTILREPLEFFIQRRNLSPELARRFVALSEIKFADGVELIFGPGRGWFLDELRHVIFKGKALGFLL